MLLLLLNYVVLRALWKIDVHLISTLVNKSIYYLSGEMSTRFTLHGWYKLVRTHGRHIQGLFWVLLKYNSWRNVNGKLLTVKHNFEKKHLKHYMNILKLLIVEKIPNQTTMFCGMYSLLLACVSVYTCNAYTW